MLRGLDQECLKEMESGFHIGRQGSDFFGVDVRTWLLKRRVYDKYSIILERIRCVWLFWFKLNHDGRLSMKKDIVDAGICIDRYLEVEVLSFMGLQDLLLNLVTRGVEVGKDNKDIVVKITKLRSYVRMDEFFPRVGDYKFDYGCGLFEAWYVWKERQVRNELCRTIEILEDGALVRFEISVFELEYRQIGYWEVLKFGCKLYLVDSLDTLSFVNLYLNVKTDSCVDELLRGWVVKRSKQVFATIKGFDGVFLDGRASSCSGMLIFRLGLSCLLNCTLVGGKQKVIRRFEFGFAES
ncbi:hypothetical protein Tco_0129249 [Tanacetum coccineum]